jgi:hypothetical protein
MKPSHLLFGSVLSSADAVFGQAIRAWTAWNTDSQGNVVCHGTAYIVGDWTYGACIAFPPSIACVKPEFASAGRAIFSTNSDCTGTGYTYNTAASVTTLFPQSVSPVQYFGNDPSKRDAEGNDTLPIVESRQIFQNLVDPAGFLYYNSNQFLKVATTLYNGNTVNAGILAGSVAAVWVQLDRAFNGGQARITNWTGTFVIRGRTLTVTIAMGAGHFLDKVTAKLLYADLAGYLDLKLLSHFAATLEKNENGVITQTGTVSANYQ